MTDPAKLDLAVQAVGQPPGGAAGQTSRDRAAQTPGGGAPRRRGSGRGSNPGGRGRRTDAGEDIAMTSAARTPATPAGLHAAGGDPGLRHPGLHHHDPLGDLQPDRRGQEAHRGGAGPGPRRPGGADAHHPRDGDGLPVGLGEPVRSGAPDHVHRQRPTGTSTSCASPGSAASGCAATSPRPTPRWSCITPSPIPTTAR